MYNIEENRSFFFVPTVLSTTLFKTFTNFFLYSSEYLLGYFFSTFDLVKGVRSIADLTLRPIAMNVPRPSVVRQCTVTFCSAYIVSSFVDILRVLIYTETIFYAQQY